MNNYNDEYINDWEEFNVPKKFKTLVSDLESGFYDNTSIYEDLIGLKQRVTAWNYLVQHGSSKAIENDFKSIITSFRTSCGNSWYNYQHRCGLENKAEKEAIRAFKEKKDTFTYKFFNNTVKEDLFYYKGKTFNISTKEVISKIKIQLNYDDENSDVDELSLLHVIGENIIYTSRYFKILDTIIPIEALDKFLFTLINRKTITYSTIGKYTTHVMDTAKLVNSEYIVRFNNGYYDQIERTFNTGDHPGIPSLIIDQDYEPVETLHPFFYKYIVDNYVPYQQIILEDVINQALGINEWKPTICYINSVGQSGTSLLFKILMKMIGMTQCGVYPPKIIEDQFFSKIIEQNVLVFFDDATITQTTIETIKAITSGLKIDSRQMYTTDTSESDSTLVNVLFISNNNKINLTSNNGRVKSDIGVDRRLRILNAKNRIKADSKDFETDENIKNLVNYYFTKAINGNIIKEPEIHVTLTHTIGYSDVSPKDHPFYKILMVDNFYGNPVQGNTSVALLYELYTRFMRKYGYRQFLSYKLFGDMLVNYVSNFKDVKTPDKHKLPENELSIEDVRWLDTIGLPTDDVPCIPIKIKPGVLSKYFTKDEIGFE